MIIVFTFQTLNFIFSFQLYILIILTIIQEDRFPLRRITNGNTRLFKHYIFTIILWQFFEVKSGVSHVRNSVNEGEISWFAFYYNIRLNFIWNCWVKGKDFSTIWCAINTLIISIKRNLKIRSYSHHRISYQSI